MARGEAKMRSPVLLALGCAGGGVELGVGVGVDGWTQGSCERLVERV